MATKRTNTTATSRLKQDYLRMRKDPVPYIVAEPLPSNILEWHYVVTGPEDSPYAGGYYHGKLIFPREYPFKPPSIYMVTPNGRFKCNTRLCLSISDFHPDSWNPSWSVSTILTGLLSFMLEKNPTLGSIETSDFVKRQFALQSYSFNLQDKTFCDLFPELAEKLRGKLAEFKVSAEGSISSNSVMSDINASSVTALPAPRMGGYLSNLVTNVIVVLALAFFAFIVKNIMSGIVE